MTTRSSPHTRCADSCADRAGRPLCAWTGRIDGFISPLSSDVHVQRAAADAGRRVGRSLAGTIGPVTSRGASGYGSAVTLAIDHLDKRFGDVVALDGLAFDAPAGRCSGSSARTARARRRRCASCSGCCGRMPAPSPGEAPPTPDVPRATWGYLPEERGLYPRMTVIEQLVYFASLYNVPAESRPRARHDWLERFRVPDLAFRRADELSKGNQQKIQLIAAILHDPEVLLMDEPFTGLDRSTSRSCGRRSWSSATRARR